MKQLKVLTFFAPSIFKFLCWTETMPKIKLIEFLFVPSANRTHLLTDSTFFIENGNFDKNPARERSQEIRQFVSKHKKAIYRSMNPRICD